MTFKSNLNIKKLGPKPSRVLLTKKLISHCIIFETNNNIFTEMAMCVAVHCKIDSR